MAGNVDARRDDFEGATVRMDDRPVREIDADGARTTERVYRDEPIPAREGAGFVPDFGPRVYREPVKAPRFGVACEAGWRHVGEIAAREARGERGAVAASLRSRSDVGEAMAALLCFHRSRVLDGLARLLVRAMYRAYAREVA